MSEGKVKKESRKESKETIIHTGILAIGKDRRNKKKVDLEKKKKGQTHDKDNNTKKKGRGSL